MKDFGADVAAGEDDDGAADDEAAVGTRTPSVPSVSVTAVTADDAATDAPGTASASALACASMPGG